jgi:DNA invertase Pin-like site-specific DNA recombinase
MNEKPPKTTLHIYTRVSTLAQADKGTSLDSQLELGIKRAGELGFGHEVWNEGGKSSHHEDISGRPVLAQLFHAIKSGQVKHLWVYDQSRLSRNDHVASIFRYECNKNGVFLYTKDGQFDLSAPQDKLLKQLLDAVAEFDNTTRAERTRLGKMHRVRTGHWHGGPPPFGYKLEDRKLAIEEHEAKWVREIFKQSLKGAVPSELKKMLDSNLVTARRGGLWTLGSIQALLKNHHYSGQYVFRDKKAEESITVQCPQIVDEVTWQGVQLAHTRAAVRSNQKNASVRHFYLLRDLMYCGHCGRPISGRINKKGGESLYFCPNKEREWAKKGKTDTPWQRGTGCGFERSMNITRADELIWQYVQEMHQKSSVLKQQVKERVLKQQGLSFVTDPKATKLAQAKLRRLQRDLQSANEVRGNLEASRLLKRMDETAYTTAVKRINEELERLEAASNEVQLELRGENERRKWVNWIDAFGAEVKNTSQYTDEQRKAYVEGIIERIDVKWLAEAREHELTIHFRLPIVGDGIEWKNPASKSQGYTLVEGERSGVVALPKRDGRG